MTLQPVTRLAHGRRARRRRQPGRPSPPPRYQPGRLGDLQRRWTGEPGAGRGCRPGPKPHRGRADDDRQQGLDQQEPAAAAGTTAAQTRATGLSAALVGSGCGDRPGATEQQTKLEPSEAGSSVGLVRAGRDFAGNGREFAPGRDGGGCQGAGPIDSHQGLHEVVDALRPRAPESGRRRRDLSADQVSVMHLSRARGRPRTVGPARSTSPRGEHGVRSRNIDPTDRSAPRQNQWGAGACSPDARDPHPAREGWPPGQLARRTRRARPAPYACLWPSPARP